MDSSLEHRDRVIRVETQLGHVAEKVGSLEDRQMQNETTFRQSLELLRDTSIRLQLATENLLATQQQDRSTHGERITKLESRVTTQESRTSVLEHWRKYVAGAMIGSSIGTAALMHLLTYLKP